MQKFFFTALCTLALQAMGVAPGNEATEHSQFTAKDLATLDRVSMPRLSPDGGFAAYAVRQTDWAANGGLQSLYLLDLNNTAAAPLALLSGERGSVNYQWSADGQWIVHLSARSGSQQVWKTRLDGQMSYQLTSFPIGVAGFRMSPDERTLFITADGYRECQTLVCNKEKDEERSSHIGSGIHVTSGPARYRDAFEGPKSASLYRVDINETSIPTDAKRILPNFPTDISIDKQDLIISVDSKTIYFAILDPSVEKGGNAWRMLFAMPSDGSSPPRRLLGGNGTSISNLALSADGKTLAYLSTPGSIWTFGRTNVALLDIKSEKSRTIFDSEDALFRQLAWASNGRRLLMTQETKGQTLLLQLDLRTNRVSRLTTAGNVSDFDTAKGKIVYLHDSLTSPQDIFLAQPGVRDRQLSFANANRLPPTRRLSSGEQFSFRGWNDEIVYGYVLKPHNYVEGDRYPIAFLIHGGPQGSFGNSWSYRWNPQVWAGMGYAVVMIDFHGSTGYGEKFALASVGHWADRPLEDLQKGWNFALSKFPFLDGTRACALGGSYGGFMINWIASQWQAPWKCLVNHAGIYDTRFLKNTIGISAFVDQQFGGAPSEADLENVNPARHVEKWELPILLTHGVNDYLVPIDQGISTYNAARRNGVPSEILIFPNENHYVLKPHNLVQWYGTIESWLNRWTENAQ